MAFEFHCQGCGAKLRVDEHLAGKEVKCPHCGAVVPAADALEREPDGSPFAGTGPALPSADEANPYASPAPLPRVDVTGPAAAGTQGITPGIHQAMAQTKPWVLFLSILGFLGGGLMTLGAGALGIMVVVEREAIGLIPALIYLLYGAFGLGCAYYLFSYSQRIGAFLATSHAAHLEAALIAQKSFWKLLGIFAVVLLAFMLLGVLSVAVLSQWMLRM